MKFTTKLDVDVVAVDTDDTVTVLIELQAPAAPAEAHRQAHTAVVVLDRSGSMAGSRLQAAKQALVSLVGRLDDRDQFGLVVFDDVAEVIAPAGPVGTVGRDQLRSAIGRVATRGLTDLSTGYLRGLQEARRACGPTGATLILLSDGHANSGVTDPQQLHDVAVTAAGIQIVTSTIGIGEDYDEQILAVLAEGGGGNHTFAHHGDAAAAAVAGEVAGLLDKTVQAASLMIATSSDVSDVALLNLGLPANTVAGGLQVELGDFYGGDRRRVALQLQVPAMAGLGLARVATVTLSFVTLPELEQHTITVPISVNIVPGDEAAGRVADPVVLRERLILQTQGAKVSAHEAIRHGRSGEAAALLQAAQERLQSAPDGVVDAELEHEAAWLANAADAVRHKSAAHSRKHLRSNSSKRGRGFVNRVQGGELADHGPDSQQ